METIVALATGSIPSAIAVLRLTGSQVRAILEQTCGSLPSPRRAEYKTFRHPQDQSILDRGLVLFFPGPSSFTGEDYAEFQLHGSQAVVSTFLDALTSIEEVRLAQAGEFTRRAVSSGKLTVLEAEGLADLISAETELQKQQAIRLESGAVTKMMRRLRDELISIRALIEADLDFSDEDDASGVQFDRLWSKVAELGNEIKAILVESERAEKLRTGLSVVLCGPPNVGKSSLLNVLSKSERAIVTDIAGTTRDVITVRVEIAGIPVELNDTAGLRLSTDEVEKEGISRAEKMIQTADLVLDMGASDVGWAQLPKVSCPIIRIQNKADLAGDPSLNDVDCLHLSVTKGSGMRVLEDRLASEVKILAGLSESIVVSRQRQRDALIKAQEALDLALSRDDLALEVRSAFLKEASDSLAYLIGETGVEDILDRLFSEFCIGK